MNTSWQVQEAKNRFSELIDRAQREGPQTITRHGRVVARVVASHGGAITNEIGAVQADGFAQYLLAMPKLESLQSPVRRSRKSAPVLGG